jgi:transcriptional regulator with XRE-family HTH domain
VAEVFELEPHERLYIHRKAIGTTQRRMAEVLGMTINFYANLELGIIHRENELPNYEISKLEECILLRRRKGWFQGQLAKELGVSRTWVNRMETGKEDPEPLFKYWNL